MASDKCDEDKVFCRQCGEELDFDPDYDALFCPRCREWREDGCGKPGCEFCAARPAVPPGGSP